MDMQIFIPSGKIILDGHKVFRPNYRPYIEVNGEQRFLTAEEARMAEEMRKAFADLIQEEQQ